MTRFAVCLDGTWNNAATERERSDGSKVYRPTNVLKLARAVKLVDRQGTSQVTYYDTGVGSMNRAPNGAARIVKKTDNLLGGALGAGFEVNIEEAYSFLANNWSEGDELFVFGFSRGAAQARSLCRFIGWVGGFPVKDDAYYVPKLFTEYLENAGAGAGADFWSRQSEKNTSRGRKPLNPIVPVTIDFLGLWDTVLALGSRFRPRWKALPEKIAFHTPPAPPANVSHIRHALSIDERRHDFQPEVFAPGGNDVKQRWFAGVHSNVGGGLSEDGLANCALAWIVDEAEALGLEVNREFLRFFRCFASGAASRKTAMYKVVDTTLRALRGFKGERDLESAVGSTLDQTVFDRLNADPKNLPKTMDGPYRPRNLMRYLKAHPELHDRMGEEALADLDGV